MLFHPQDPTRLSITILCVVYTASRQSAGSPESDAVGQQQQQQQQQLQTNWLPMEDSWNYWWSYSGPAYWGLLNPDWSLCHKGRHQSPIDIQTRLLVYDPRLKPLRGDNNLISGVLLNDGHSIVFNCSRAAVLSAAAAAAADSAPLLANQTDSLSAVDGKRDSPERLIDGALGGFSSLTLDKDQQDLLQLTRTSVETTISQTNQLLGNSAQLEAHQSADSGQQQQQQPQEVPRIRFSGAGLAYQYQLETIYFKFGASASGSEHQINSRSFAAELQLFAFNSVLFESFAEASTRPNGLLAISALAKVVGDESSSSPLPSQVKPTAREWPNEQLERLLTHLAQVNYRGSSTLVSGVNLTALLPELDEFVTYSGSLSQPSCQESVNWLILNRPLLMSQSSLDKLRSLSADEQLIAPSGTLLAGNLRPIQPTNGRPIRTNIKPTHGNEPKDSGETCQRLWTKYAYKQAQ